MNQLPIYYLIVVLAFFGSIYHESQEGGKMEHYGFSIFEILTLSFLWPILLAFWIVTKIADWIWGKPE